VRRTFAKMGGVPVALAGKKGAFTGALRSEAVPFRLYSWLTCPGPQPMFPGTGWQPRQGDWWKSTPSSLVGERLAHHQTGGTHCRGAALATAAITSTNPNQAAAATIETVNGSGAPNMRAASKSRLSLAKISSA
jgi:hypothetical protein